MTADPLLTPAEAEAVVARRLAQITPPRLPQRAAGARPWVILIGGQPAAGKSTIQELIQAALDAERVASYDFDDDPAAHPRYDAIMRAHDFNGNDVVARSLPPDLRDRCMEHLRTGEYDVVASAPMQSEHAAKSWIDDFRAAGYRVTVVYVATNEAESLLGAANRYQQAKDDTGIGRGIRLEHHNEAYGGVPDAAHELEAQGYVDDIYVVDRSGAVLYENHRGDDGRMERPLGAREAIIAGRNRPPTPAEHQHFVETALPLRQRGDELEQPVDELVRAAMWKQIERPGAQPGVREPVLDSRLDQRLIDLRRVTGSGVALPHTIGPPTGTSSRPQTARGPNAGRSRDV